MTARVDAAVLDVLARFVSDIHARTILTSALRRMGASRVDPAFWDALELCRQLRVGLSLFAPASDVEACVRGVQEVLRERRPPGPGSDANRPRILPVHGEGDVVAARAAARDLCARIGFGTTDQVKVATVVSELARNIHQYAGRGEIVITPLAAPARGIEVVARDSGPGIRDLDAVLSGRYRSKTGLGRGLAGCRGIMDDLQVDTDDHGTTVRARKRLRT